jgi:hypothetical protein
VVRDDVSFLGGSLMVIVMMDSSIFYFENYYFNWYFNGSLYLGFDATTKDINIP